MKKFFAFAFTTALFVACGDDNSSSANDDEVSKNEPTSSSNGTSSEDGWITTEAVDHFSFFDEEHLRYYFLDEECDYDPTTNTFKWVTEDYTGLFDKYGSSELDEQFGGDSLKLLIYHSFGYKISNDTLYECDYIGDACDTIEDATVYVGSSNSIFSTWECVGRIYDGKYSDIPSNYKTTLTLTPKQRTITTRSKKTGLSPEPFQYCGLIHELSFDDQKVERCYSDLRHIQNFSNDTTFIGNDMWILAKDPNKVVFSIDNHIFEISLNYTFEMNPTENITYTKKITYQGKTCTNWVKNFDITQEYCEATEHDMDLLKNEYSDIQRTFVDQLRSSSDNDDEFKDCLKQFNLK
jgi:hypothetical protein